MSKFVVLAVFALCALVALASAVPFPLPAGPAPAPKETLKGAEQVYYAGYGAPVAYAGYGGYAAYPYAYYG